MVSKKDILNKIDGLEKKMQVMDKKQKRETQHLLELFYPINLKIYFSSLCIPEYIRTLEKVVSNGYVLKSIYESNVSELFYSHTEFWAKEDDSKNT